MNLYCLCQITGPGQYQMGKVLDHQVFLAQNRMVRPKENEDYFSVVLSQAMNVVQAGIRRLFPTAKQEFPNRHPKTTGTRVKEQEHIRKNTKPGPANVTLYHCPRCSSMICVAE